MAIGGLATAIGYWLYAKVIHDSVIASIFANADSDEVGYVVASYVGYSIFIGGYAFVWAADIALDDITNR